MDSDSFDMLLKSLRRIAGTNFVAIQMLDELNLSRPELIDFLKLLEKEGFLDCTQHSEDHEGKMYPSVFRLKA